MLVSLPAGDDEHRRAHLALFEPRTKQVFVKSKRLGGTLFLTCIARNAAEAEAIVAEVNRAVRVGGSLFLIPPWDPDDRRPPAERTRHDRARQTYEKIVNAANDLYDDPELKSLVDKLDDATRRGDAAESEKLQSDHEKLYEVKLRAAQRRVAETADGSIDAELAERFLALQDPTARTVGFKRYVTELGPLMGQVPMDGDAPAAGAERYIASFGSASREGLLVTIRGLTFADDAQGAPALVAWLGGRGCVDFRYRFSAAGLPQDFDLTLEP